MAGVPVLKSLSVRPPAVSGRFYPDSPAACREGAARLVDGARRVADGAGNGAPPAGRAFGGVVPHASWICSGAIAAQTLAFIDRANAAQPPSVVVVFAAVHTPIALEQAALDSHGLWNVPSGQTPASLDLAEALASSSPLFVMDDRFHQHDHAVEVELPLIQHVWPNCELLPIEVPLIDQAAKIGRETARRVLSTWRRAIFLASSDLTHYGPNYRFTPAGVGPAAIAWAKENDQRLLQRIGEMAIDDIVPQVRQRMNACGGGAIAAMLAACQEAGAVRATLLRHANSYETLAGLTPDDPSNAVGYASVVLT